MSNLFEDVLNDAKGVEQELLGPAYPYYANIKTPSQIGMSDNGSISALTSDINGLIQYVEVLVSGNSKASSTGKPLGNKFFLKTGAKCKDVASGDQVDRYIYIDNVPAGNIPFISQGLGVNFTEFKGLIPGAMGNLNALNPFALSQAFLAGSVPDCQALTMETISVDNVTSSETNYVTLVDIQNMDACTFSDSKNPVSGETCQETFKSMQTTLTPIGMSTQTRNEKPIEMSSDPLVNLYFFGLTLVGLYVLTKLMNKHI
jgi:hypothetical protein